MRCVVGYMRLANSELDEDPRLGDMLVRKVHAHAASYPLPVAGMFIDRYGVRRSPLTQLALALDAARELDGLLVIPTLGKTRRDPEFLETLYNAEIPLEVLDQPRLSRDTILAAAMASFRADLRRD